MLDGTRVELGDQPGAFDAFRARHRRLPQFVLYGRAAIQEAARSCGQPSARRSPARLPGRRPSSRPRARQQSPHRTPSGCRDGDDAIAECGDWEASGQGSPLVDATIARAEPSGQTVSASTHAARVSAVHGRGRGGTAAEILTVIFPIDHWPLLRAEAAAKKLDPYLVAALVAQESTFRRTSSRRPMAGTDADSAGHRPPIRRDAGDQGRFRFRLVEPEVNVRIGTT